MNTTNTPGVEPTVETEGNSENSIFVKILIIIGFIATFVLLAWLLVQGIKLLSPSFEQAASVADGTENYAPSEELILETDKNITNSGESFEISWNDMKQDGEYKFTYACITGVVTLVRNTSGDLVPLKCTETVTLPATEHELFLRIDSHEQRYADVELQLVFVSDENDKSYIDNIIVTVVNAEVDEEGEDDNNSSDDDSIDDNVIENSDPVPTPVRPVNTTIYPKSNPNGYIDLEVTNLGSGVMYGDTFVQTSELDTDHRNAYRFSIKNIGTKTSGYWGYELELPGDVEYESEDNIPLRPTERVEFIVGFDIDDDEEDSYSTITVESITSNDLNSSNNFVAWNVEIE